MKAIARQWQNQLEAQLERERETETLVSEVVLEPESLGAAERLCGYGFGFCADGIARPFTYHVSQVPKRHAEDDLAMRKLVGTLPADPEHDYEHLLGELLDTGIGTIAVLIRGVVEGGGVFALLYRHPGLTHEQACTILGHTISGETRVS